MDGSIDDVRIYDYALTSSEITNLANGKYADGDDGTATYTLNTALDVDNDLYIQSGILDVSGTSYAITLANDWNNYAGASGFTDQSGTVTLDGVDQAVRGTTTFYNFTKQETTDDTTDKNLTFGVGNDTSLIGYWKFDEGTGTAATDSSANSNSGTLTNMEAGDWDSSIKASLNFQNDYSLEFDADDDEVDIGDIAAYDDPFSSGGTVSAWINADGYGESDNGNIIGNANFDGAPYGGWVFYTRSTNSGLSFYQTRGTTGGQWTCAVGLDAWHHVVITYDSSSTANDPQCYVDGLAVATTEVSAPDGAVNAVGQNFRIGNRHDGARTFDGHIDDVRIYNRALSQAEITELAAGNGVPAIYEYDVANTLDIDGLDTNDRLNVISSTTNVPFLLDVTAADACTNWLDVTDSLAGTYDIYADNTTDSGGNDEDWSTPFWVFSSCPAATRNRLMIINTAD
ncbi:hypothetical protein CL628_03800 [bacterium]|nr:hypothetical protein [bacterium]